MSGSVTQADLLPCPFCGGAAGFNEGHRDHWRVVCMSCGIRHPRLVARQADPRPELVAAWNQRASVSPLVEALVLAREWIAYDPPAGPAEEAACDRLLAKIDAALAEARGQ